MITRITTPDFRRTQTTLMNLACNDLKYIASYLGHQDTAITTRYYIKDTEDLQNKNDVIKFDFHEKNDII